MLNQKIEDRYGNELTVGSEVIYADYSMDSNLYEGKITEMKPKTFTVKCEHYGYRRVLISEVNNKLILNPHKK